MCDCITIFRTFWGKREEGDMEEKENKGERECERRGTKSMDPYVTICMHAHACMYTNTHTHTGSGFHFLFSEVAILV